MTDVRPSSSDARLPPFLLPTLMRLLLLGEGRTMTLIGRWRPGDDGDCGREDGGREPWVSMAEGMEEAEAAGACAADATGGSMAI